MTVPQDAEAPFNNKKSADVVLRSADQVDFHVHKVILSFASSYFRDILRTKQYHIEGIAAALDDPIAEQPAIIDVEEDSSIIDYILRCCYPIAKPELSYLDDIRDVLDAAQKYGMVAVAEAWVLKDALIKLAGEYPLDVMSIYIRCGLDDVFRVAFKHSLELPSLLPFESDELDRLSGGQYYALVSSHRHRTVPQDLSSQNLVTRTKPDYLPCKAPHRDAHAPFDDTNADVILRSCDQIDFYVYKSILSIASPFFRDMLNVSQPSVLPASAKNELFSQPIIDLDEDAETIDFILRCIYPVDVPELEHADIYFVLQAGDKYNIKDAIRVAKAALITLVNEDAIAAFALGVQCQLEHICSMAARRVLGEDLEEESSSCELNHISARPVRELLQYYQECAEAASAVARSREWIDGNFLGSIMTKGKPWGPYCCEDKQNPGWWAHQEVWKYLKEAERAVLLCPHYDGIFFPWLPIDDSCKRVQCGRQSYGRDLSQALKSAVEEATSEEEIPIPKFC